ncbi:unnamed protein product [Mesocestoides corti]|uniref:Uncharacterized protein n=1 Tax=Mesocestoides corti TaxID=53468 RepID=A0A0R3U1U6_MESCO|nr:unnamed protein product [Mesocestoides corti]
MLQKHEGLDAEGQDYEDSAKRQIKKHVEEIRQFFREDALGRKIVSLFKELIGLLQSAKQKARSALRAHVKKLIKEEDDD